MTALKRLSDALLVLAVVLVVVALVGPSWVWWVAGFCLLDAVVVAVWRRRALKAARPS